MCLFVGFSQPASADVGVNLGGCEAFVSEEFLDAAKICTSVKQVGGERVPERVGSGLLRQSGGGDVGFQQSADAAGGQPATEAVQEHGEPLFFRGFRIRLSHFQPLVECFGGVAADGSEPFLATFPEDSHDAGSAVPVSDIESYQLGDSQAGGVHGFQNGPVANSGWSICRRSCEQRADLFGGEEVGQFAAAAGSAQRPGGIGFADSITIAVAKEAAETGQSSGDGGASVAAFVEPCDVAAEDRSIDLCRVRNFPGVFLQKFADVVEVIGVGLDRQFGRIAFNFEEAEESLDGRIHDFRFAGWVRTWVGAEALSVVAGATPRSIGWIAVLQNLPKFACGGRENAVCDCAEGGLRA
jgi:hypothetical protein